MEFEQLRVYPTGTGKICLSQDGLDGEEAYKIILTADMVDMVCGELQRIKKEIQGGENGRDCE